MRTLVSSFYLTGFNVLNYYRRFLRLYKHKKHFSQTTESFFLLRKYSKLNKKALKNRFYRRKIFLKTFKKDLYYVTNLSFLYFIGGLYRKHFKSFITKRKKMFFSLLKLKKNLKIFKWRKFFFKRTLCSFRNVSFYLKVYRRFFNLSNHKRTPLKNIKKSLKISYFFYKFSFIYLFIFKFMKSNLLQQVKRRNRRFFFKNFYNKGKKKSENYFSTIWKKTRNFAVVQTPVEKSYRRPFLTPFRFSKFSRKFYRKGKIKIQRRSPFRFYLFRRRRYTIRFFLNNRRQSLSFFLNKTSYPRIRRFGQYVQDRAKQSNYINFYFYPYFSSLNLNFFNYGFIYRFRFLKTLRNVYYFYMYNGLFKHKKRKKRHFRFYMRLKYKFIRLIRFIHYLRKRGKNQRAKIVYNFFYRNLYNRLKFVLSFRHLFFRFRTIYLQENYQLVGKIIRKARKLTKKLHLLFYFKRKYPRNSRQFRYARLNKYGWFYYKQWLAKKWSYLPYSIIKSFRTVTTSLYGLLPFLSVNSESFFLRTGGYVYFPYNSSFLNKRLFKNRYFIYRLNFLLRRLRFFYGKLTKKFLFRFFSNLKKKYRYSYLYDSRVSYLLSNLETLLPVVLMRLGFATNMQKALHLLKMKCVIVNNNIITDRFFHVQPFDFIFVGSFHLSFFRQFFKYLVFGYFHIFLKNFFLKLRVKKHKFFEKKKKKLLFNFFYNLNNFMHLNILWNFSSNKKNHNFVSLKKKNKKINSLLPKAVPLQNFNSKFNVTSFYINPKLEKLKKRFLKYRIRRWFRVKKSIKILGKSKKLKKKIHYFKRIYKKFIVKTFKPLFFYKNYKWLPVSDFYKVFFHRNLRFKRLARPFNYRVRAKVFSNLLRTTEFSLPVNSFRFLNYSLSKTLKLSSIRDIKNFRFASSSFYNLIKYSLYPLQTSTIRRNITLSKSLSSTMQKMFYNSPVAFHLNSHNILNKFFRKSSNSTRFRFLKVLKKKKIKVSRRLLYRANLKNFNINKVRKTSVSEPAKISITPYSRRSSFKTSTFLGFLTKMDTAKIFSNRAFSTKPVFPLNNKYKKFHNFKNKNKNKNKTKNNNNKNKHNNTFKNKNKLNFNNNHKNNKNKYTTFKNKNKLNFNKNNKYKKPYNFKNKNKNRYYGKQPRKPFQKPVAYIRRKRELMHQYFSPLMDNTNGGLLKIHGDKKKAGQLFGLCHALYRHINKRDFDSVQAINTKIRNFIRERVTFAYDYSLFEVLLGYQKNQLSDRSFLTLFPIFSKINSYSSFLGKNRSTFVNEDSPISFDEFLDENFLYTDNQSSGFNINMENLENIIEFFYDDFGYNEGKFQKFLNRTPFFFWARTKFRNKKRRNYFPKFPKWKKLTKYQKFQKIILAMQFKQRKMQKTFLNNFLLRGNYRVVPRKSIRISVGDRTKLSRREFSILRTKEDAALRTRFRTDLGVFLKKFYSLIEEHQDFIIALVEEYNRQIKINQIKGIPNKFKINTYLPFKLRRNKKKLFWCYVMYLQTRASRRKGILNLFKLTLTLFFFNIVNEKINYSTSAIFSYKWRRFFKYIVNFFEKKNTFLLSDLLKRLTAIKPHFRSIYNYSSSKKKLTKSFFSQMPSLFNFKFSKLLHRRFNFKFLALPKFSRFRNLTTSRYYKKLLLDISFSERLPIFFSSYRNGSGTRFRNGGNTMSLLINKNESSSLQSLSFFYKKIIFFDLAILNFFSSLTNFCYTFCFNTIFLKIFNNKNFRVLLKFLKIFTNKQKFDYLDFNAILTNLFHFSINSQFKLIHFFYILFYVSQYDTNNSLLNNFNLFKNIINMLKFSYNKKYIVLSSFKKTNNFMLHKFSNILTYNSFLKSQYYMRYSLFKERNSFLKFRYSPFSRSRHIFYFFLAYRIIFSQFRRYKRFLSIYFVKKNRIFSYSVIFHLFFFFIKLRFSLRFRKFLYYRKLKINRPNYYIQYFKNKINKRFVSFKNLQYYEYSARLNLFIMLRRPNFFYLLKKIYLRHYFSSTMLQYISDLFFYNY